MKLQLYCVATIFLFTLSATGASPETATLRGAVITSDGSMVDEFTITAKPLADKPELVQRRRFKNGIFRLNDLGSRKYLIIVTAPTFIGVRMEVDIPKNAPSTHFRLVMLHKLRNVRYFPGDPIQTVSLDTLMQTIPEEAKEHYEKGVELHRDGQLNQALTEYGEAMRLYPKYVQAITDSGTIYLLLNYPDVALMFFRRAQEIDRKNGVIRLNVAAAMIHKKQYDDSIKLLNSLLKDSQDKTLPTLFLARAYYLQKKYPLAESMARAALQADPELLDGWLLILNMGIETKNFALAREGLSKLKEALNNRAFSELIDDEIATLDNGSVN